MQYLRNVAKTEAMSGLDVKNLEEDRVIRVPKEKMRRLPLPKESERERGTSFGEMIHSNVCGP